MDGEPVLWERVEWRQGDGRYVFEVARGGLHATLTAPSGQSLTLPRVAWDALLDAVTAARKARSRSERHLPPRAGARWTQIETDELTAAFKSGATTMALAQAHHRTGFAIEGKLAELGLWDRIERRPTASAGVPRASPAIPDWPPEPPPWPGSVEVSGRMTADRHRAEPQAERP